MESIHGHGQPGGQHLLTESVIDLRIPYSSDNQRFIYTLGRIGLLEIEDAIIGRPTTPEQKIFASACLHHLADLELDRTRDYFDRCRSLDGLLATDGRLVFRAMFGVYRTMFEILERHRNELFGNRITIGKRGILFGALKAIVMGTGRAGGRIRAFKKSDT